MGHWPPRSVGTAPAARERSASPLPRSLPNFIVACVARLGELVDGRHPIPRQRAAAGLRHDVAAVAVHLLLGLPPHLLRGAPRSAASAPRRSRPRGSAPGECPAASPRDAAKRYCASLSPRVVANRVRLPGALGDDPVRGGDARGDGVEGVEQEAGALVAPLDHRAEGGLVAAVALNVLVTHRAHRHQPQLLRAVHVAGARKARLLRRPPAPAGAAPGSSPRAAPPRTAARASRGSPPAPPPAPSPAPRSPRCPR